MSKLKFVVGLIVVGSIATAHAEWGHGEGDEYKTITVPQNQQSGWGLKTEIHPKKEAATSVPASVPVAAPSEQSKPIPQSSWILEGVQFESGSDKLKPESKDALDDAAKTLKAHEQVVVEIQGHSDSTGNAAYNKELSQKRALAVKDYLAKQGVQTAQLQATGYGSSQPIAENTTAAGRAQNRRIEFKVLNK